VKLVRDVDILLVDDYVCEYMNGSDWRVKYICKCDG
jgi:hypothetical protein